MRFCLAHAVLVTAVGPVGFWRSVIGPLASNGGFAFHWMAFGMKISLALGSLGSRHSRIRVFALVGVGFL